MTVLSTESAALIVEEPVKSRRGLWIAAGAAVLLGLVAGFLAGRQTSKRPVPSIRQVTFRRGDIQSARFGPDGQTIVYGAAWDGKTPQLYTARTDSTASRRLELSNALLCSISSQGEMAVLMGHHNTFQGPIGTLARLPLAGDAARTAGERASRGMDSRWQQPRRGTRHGRRLAARISYRHDAVPIARLDERSGILPSGDVIAFLDHPTPGDDAGSVAIVDRSGKKTTLSAYYESSSGLAWAPNGEIWFTASEPGRRTVAIVDSGEPLRYAPDPEPHGRHHGLTGRGARWPRADGARPQRFRNFGRISGEVSERELTWLDNPIDADLSADGKTLLIAEAAAGEGQRYGGDLRATDGKDAVRLGDGYGNALSPDGRHVSAILYGSPKQLILMPTGAGETKTLPRGPIDPYVYSNWTHDGRHVVFTATEPGHGLRGYVQDVTGGPPRAFAPDLVPELSLPVSPDDRWVARHTAGGGIRLFAVDGSGTRDVAGGAPGEGIIQFTADGKSLFVANLFASHARVFKLEIATGKRELWKDLTPADPAGVVLIQSVRITPDERSYIYGCFRVLSNLYVMTGL